MSGLVAAGAVQGVVPERQQGRQQGQHLVVVQVVVPLAEVVVVVAVGQVGLEQAAEFRGLELGLQPSVKPSPAIWCDNLTILGFR